MGSAQLPLRNTGIYHNLPTFDPNIKNLTAMITGANGISGFHTLRALLDSPQRWTKIYAVSRRPPPPEMMALLTPDQRGRVEHIASDFLKSAEEIAEAIKGSGLKGIDYIFFYSYLQPPPPAGAPIWSNADELVQVNSSLLSNFLSALPLANLTPKRILLQTGAKNYGLHIGRSRLPAIESDPQPTHLDPNFYYPQEKLLFDYCNAHPNTAWNIIMPAWIVGATGNAQMNALLPFSWYAAVCAKRGVKLQFPSNWESWQGEQHHSSARLTGYLSEWAVLEAKCANMRFNSQDGGAVSMDRFFERLAAWFDVKAGVGGPPDTEENMVGVPGKAGKEAPMGYGPAHVNRFAFTLSGWATEQANHDAWREIMRESGGKIAFDPFEDVEANFAFGDGAYVKIGCLSMGKARGMGWTGFVDTFQGIFEMYTEMGPGGLGMVSQMTVKETGPMV